jgi:hypothetical protein
MRLCLCTCVCVACTSVPQLVATSRRAAVMASAASGAMQHAPAPHAAGDAPEASTQPANAAGAAADADAAAAAGWERLSTAGPALFYRRSELAGGVAGAMPGSSRGAAAAAAAASRGGSLHAAAFLLMRYVKLVKRDRVKVRAGERAVASQQKPGLQRRPGVARVAAAAAQPGRAQPVAAQRRRSRACRAAGWLCGEAGCSSGREGWGGARSGRVGRGSARFWPSLARTSFLFHSCPPSRLRTCGL